MPGRTLTETPFLEMLPESLRSDEDMIAMSKVLDVMFYLGDVEVGNVLIWSRINGMEEPLLSNLAYQLHLEGYEGWHVAKTVEHKRRLLKEAINLHRYKGTRYALERIFEILDMRGGGDGVVGRR